MSFSLSSELILRMIGAPAEQAVRGEGPCPQCGKMLRVNHSDRLQSWYWCCACDLTGDDVDILCIARQSVPEAVLQDYIDASERKDDGGYDTWLEQWRKRRDESNTAQDFWRDCKTRRTLSDNCDLHTLSMKLGLSKDLRYCRLPPCVHNDIGICSVERLMEWKHPLRKLLRTATRLTGPLQLQKHIPDVLVLRSFDAVHRLSGFWVFFLDRYEELQCLWHGLDGRSNGVGWIYCARESSADDRLPVACKPEVAARFVLSSASSSSHASSVLCFHGSSKTILTAMPNRIPAFFDFDDQVTAISSARECGGLVVDRPTPTPHKRRQGTPELRARQMTEGAVGWETATLRLLSGYSAAQHLDAAIAKINLTADELLRLLPYAPPDLRHRLEFRLKRQQQRREFRGLKFYEEDDVLTYHIRHAKVRREMQNYKVRVLRIVRDRDAGSVWATFRVSHGSNFLDGSVANLADYASTVKKLGSTLMSSIGKLATNLTKGWDRHLFDLHCLFSTPETVDGATTVGWSETMGCLVFPRFFVSSMRECDFLMPESERLPCAAFRRSSPTASEIKLLDSDRASPQSAWQAIRLTLAHVASYIYRSDHDRPVHSLVLGDEFMLSRLFEATGCTDDRSKKHRWPVLGTRLLESPAGSIEPTSRSNRRLEAVGRSCRVVDASFVEEPTQELREAVTSVTAALARKAAQSEPGSLKFSTHFFKSVWSEWGGNPDHIPEIAYLSTGSLVLEWLKKAWEFDPKLMSKAGRYLCASLSRLEEVEVAAGLPRLSASYAAHALRQASIEAKVATSDRSELLVMASSVPAPSSEASHHRATKKRR